MSRYAIELAEIKAEVAQIIADDPDAAERLLRDVAKRIAADHGRAAAVEFLMGLGDEFAVMDAPYAED